MEFWTFIGYIAALCGAVSLIPEVIKGARTHHLQDVSWGMLGLLFFGSTLWGLYGMKTDDFPLVFSAVMNITCNATLMLMKKHYELTGKPLFSRFKKSTIETSATKKSGKRAPGLEPKLKPALETEPVMEEEVLVKKEEPAESEKI